MHLPPRRRRRPALTTKPRFLFVAGQRRSPPVYISLTCSRPCQSRSLLGSCPRHRLPLSIPDASGMTTMLSMRNKTKGKHHNQERRTNLLWISMDRHYFNSVLHFHFHYFPINYCLAEELNVADIAVQTLLKLTLAVQKGSDSVIRRAAVKVVVGELQSRREQLEKTLLQLEQKIDEIYRLIVALRMSILGLLSEAQMEDEVGLVNSCSWSESQLGPNSARLQAARNWIIVQTKLTKRACSLRQIGSSLRLIQSETIKPNLL